MPSTRRGLENVIKLSQAPHRTSGGRTPSDYAGNHAVSGHLKPPEPDFFTMSRTKMDQGHAGMPKAKFLLSRQARFDIGKCFS